MVSFPVFVNCVDLTLTKTNWHNNALLAKLTGLIAMDELVDLAGFATGWITQTTPSHDLSYSVDLFKYIFVTQIKQIKYI